MRVPAGRQLGGGRRGARQPCRFGSRHSCLHAAGRFATSRHPSRTVLAGPAARPDWLSLAAARIERWAQGGGGRPGRTHAAVPVVCRRGPCAASGRDRVLLRSVTVCDACPACLLLASPRTTPRFLLGASCALSPLLHLLPAISFASLPHHTALSDYSAQYETARGTYLEAAKALKMATGPYKASRDAYVAAGACRLAGAMLPPETCQLEERPWI